MISSVRCSMASERKPICRLCRSAANVVGPAITMRLSLWMRSARPLMRSTSAYSPSLLKNSTP